MPNQHTLLPKRRSQCGAGTGRVAREDKVCRRRQHLEAELR